MISALCTVYLRSVLIVRFFIYLTILFIPLTAAATSPPLECVGEAPQGYEMAYPSFPIGYFTWFLFVFALYISISSHKTISGGARKPSPDL